MWSVGVQGIDLVLNSIKRDVAPGKPGVPVQPGAIVEDPAESNFPTGSEQISSGGATALPNGASCDSCDCCLAEPQRDLGLPGKSHLAVILDY